MKKQYVNFISILFAALCFAFTACNQGMTTGGETGTVRIVIGGEGAVRSVDGEGLPVFDETNTKITVTDKDGTELAKGNGKTPVELTLNIDTKITVKVVVTTAAGVWRGSKEHTVTAGNNDVVVKLSKTPKSVGNVLSKVKRNKPQDVEITLKLANGKELIDDVKIRGNHQGYPVIARDGKGRIYVLYDKGSSRHFTRFDAEGNEDADFETAITSVLPSSVRIRTMTVDAKTNTIFVFDTFSPNVYALTESSPNVFTCSGPFDISTLPVAATALPVSAAAAYNGVLFLATSANKLIACDVTLSGTSLTLVERAIETLENLRPSSLGGWTACTGLFADKSGVYCLLYGSSLRSPQWYMVGALVHYTYSEGGLANKTVKGLHSKAGGNDPSLTFEEKAFVNPVGFIGYDEDYLYIADDGAEISENPYIDFCIAGNKNRIAKVNRDTKVLTFEDSASDVTWFAEYREYPPTKIPHLLWSRDEDGHVTLKLKTLDGSVKELVQDINTRQQDKLMTARDSAGNVYVLYCDSTPTAQLHLERFSADGTKDNNFGTAKTGFTLPDTDITDLAVDFKTADVFLLKRTMAAGLTDTVITAYMAKADTGYASFSGPATVTMPDVRGAVTIDAVAAFDGTLFFAMDVKVGSDNVKKLYAYKMQTAGIFAFTTDKTETELSKLRDDDKNPMVCTGLFADRKGVYGMLAQKNVIGGAAFYALGKIVRYTYDGSTQLTPVALSGNNSGLNPAAATPGSIGYDAQYFSYPAGFLGYDGDNLYIADDGVDITELNENHRVNGNQDRIMAFDRKNDTLSASSLDLDGATWFKSYDKYTYPETKMLLWEKGSSQYWVGDNGTEAYSSSSALSTTPSQQLTDVFCYDQNGNLYIVVCDGLDYKVKRFTPTDTGLNSTGDMKIKNEQKQPVSIAVDVSGGTNILYYGTNDYSPLKWAVKKIEWQDSFDGERAPEPFTSFTREELTSLAANKDGVFVGVKQIYEESVGVNQIPKYRLKVKKFLKGTHANGSVTVVENDPLYVSAPGSTNPHTPIPKPASSSHDPYIEYEEAISDLQVVEGTLYAIMEKAEKIRKYNTVEDACTIDEFKMSSALYKVGKKTADGFSGNADKLAEKRAVPPAGANPGVGYGFYRFIAVKPKKLVIASDGAWGKEGNSASHVEADNDKVLTYDLDGNLNSPEEKDTAGKFSKELQRSSSGFNWE
ncbi:hypothetical protein HMPREF9195_01318 [Treponema medium ATCC 700293]|uniref:Uncharacterized protein n=1 Tax=Treponema medium ATCC 700293 TaxID=1125700 RepID=A0AA87NPZ7_TREMD|nr:hypothetical protein [Treponema medium]EPF28620.1 hypothetical protein HMPREF9195_01318 [Treponema medium ATCC 700293]